MNTREIAVGQKDDLAVRVFIYIILGILAITIIIPVAWVFMASIKQNKEFYGNPFALPEGVYLQNFVDAWTKARMGEYFMTSIMITALALAILLVVALPAAYVLSRFKFMGNKIHTRFFVNFDCPLPYPGGAEGAPIDSIRPTPLEKSEEAIYNEYFAEEASTDTVAKKESKRRRKIAEKAWDAIDDYLLSRQGADLKNASVRLMPSIAVRSGSAGSYSTPNTSVA